MMMMKVAALIEDWPNPVVEKRKKKLMLRLEGRCGSDIPSVKVHLIPFTIECKEPHQPAHVSSYFVTTTTSATHTASFRGRELRGVVAQVPDGCVGAVVSVDPPGVDHESSRKGRVDGTFEEITVWDHDFVPMESDNFFEWLKWPAFSASIHQEVPRSCIDERTEKMP